MSKKHGWLIICVNMMIGYIPQEIDTWDSYNKFQDVCEHFISASTIFGARLKAERNLSDVMIDDDETIGKLAQIMKRFVTQSYGFDKNQQEENKVIMVAALRKYEDMLGNEKLSMFQQTVLRNGINELKRMLNEAEG